MSHVTTQLPYAWFIAGCCAVGYLAAGLSHGSWIISFGATFITFAGILAFMWNRSLDVKKFEKVLNEEEKLALAAR